MKLTLNPLETLKCEIKCCIMSNYQLTKIYKQIKAKKSKLLLWSIITILLYKSI